MDFTRLVAEMLPAPDGESPVRHRTGIVTVINSDGTADITLDGETVPDVAVLNGVPLIVGDAVQVLAWAGDLLILGVAASRVTDFDLLAIVTADGSSATMAASSLPQTHRDLAVIVHGSHPAASGQQQRNVTLRLNNDSGSNYRWVRIDTDDNGTPTRSSAISTTGIILPAFGDDTDLSMVRVDIPSYSAARNKAVAFAGGSSFGSSAGQSRAANGWGAHIDNTACTDVRVIMTTELWRSGSTMRIYGLGRLI